MLSFKQFLYEQAASFTLDDIVRDCSEFLEQCGKQPLYRGLKPRPDADITLHHTRTDRVPRDMNKELSARLDVAIEDVVGFKTRSAGTFSTGNGGLANEYGTLCLVFPKNGFQFAWSPAIQDPFVNFELDSDNAIIQFALDKLADHFEAQGQKNQVDLLQTASASIIIKTMLKLADEGDSTIIDEVVKLVAESYSTTDLEKAIRSGNELIFTGDYYAIPMSATETLAGRAINAKEFMQLMVDKL